MLHTTFALWMETQESSAPLQVRCATFDTCSISKVLLTAGKPSDYGSGIPALYGFGGNGGPATSALFASIQSLVAIDNEVYVSDANNHYVRKMTCNLVSTPVTAPTIAPTNSRAPSVVPSVTQTVAPTLVPTSKPSPPPTPSPSVTPSCTVSLYAGVQRRSGGAIFSGDGGAASSAYFFRPYGLWVSPVSEKLFAVDENNYRVRSIQLRSKRIKTIAGNGQQGTSWTVDTTYVGGATDVKGVMSPHHICGDRHGNLYVVEQAIAIVRKVSSTGILSAFAGNMKGGNTGLDGPATAASLNMPSQCAVDGDDVYIVDYGNNLVKTVSVTTSIITVFAGTGASSPYQQSAPLTAANLLQPGSMFIDLAGNFFLADYYARIWKSAADSDMLTTYAGIIYLHLITLLIKVFFLFFTGTGSNTAVASGDGGQATSAGVRAFGMHITLDRSGNMYVSSFSTPYIRLIKGDTGIITTVAGRFCCFCS